MSNEPGYEECVTMIRGERRITMRLIGTREPYAPVPYVPRLHPNFHGPFQWFGKPEEYTGRPPA